MTDLEPSTPVPPQPSNRERLSRAWTITSAVIVALIVLAAVVVVLATRGGGKVPSTAAPTSPPSDLPQATPTVATTAPVQDQTVPVVAPAGVTWSLFQGVALPSSRTAGPRRVTGFVHAGYTQTPTGALLAAAQIGYRYLITPGDDWRRVVQEQVVPGPGRDKYTQERSKVTTTTVAPGTYGQLAGFRFVTYAPDTAVIQYVTRFSNGNLQVATNTVHWQDDDWKLQLQPDGSESPTVQSTNSLSGFVPWSGL